MAPIDDALKALGSQEAPNYAEYARKFKVPRSTLRGAQGSIEAGREKASLLSHIQQLELVKYVNMLSARGLPLTNIMVTNFAAENCGKPPGKNWCTNFMKAHSKVLVSDYLPGLGLNRKQADSAIVYARYFDKVSVAP